VDKTCTCNGVSRDCQIHHTIRKDLVWRSSGKFSDLFVARLYVETMGGGAKIEQIRKIKYKLEVIG
jgi:hypothetical protein